MEQKQLLSSGSRSSSGSQTLSESEEIKSILDTKVCGGQSHDSESESVTEVEGERDTEEAKGDEEDEDEKVNTQNKKHLNASETAERDAHR